MLKRFFLLLATMPLLLHAQFRVTSLTVEHTQDPAVVDAERPRLSWVNEPRDERIRGDRQTAYRIVVASTEEDLRHGRYDLWDSGRVPSDQSVLVPYGGGQLSSGLDCYWQVQTWNARGKRSRWSAVGHWGMGLLHDADWQAQWIGAAQQTMGATLFRKSFMLKRKVKKAKAFVTAGGYFELYVNGQRIGNDYLVPNFTNYSTRTGLDKGGIALDPHFTAYRVMYLAYDITAQLNAGRNAVGAILGNGFYHTESWRVCSFGTPCLLCQMEIIYEDGSHETIATDQTWLTRPSAITMNGIYEGETYDARQETPAWAEPDTNESGWQQAILAPPPTGKLTAHTAPTDRITEVLKPQSIVRTDSCFVVTFEKEVAGWVRLKNFHGQTGQHVCVKYISESPLGKQEYICKGNGRESYAPRFTWFVFSQVEVSGLDSLTPEQIQAEAVNTDVRPWAEFRTSNPLINSIYQMWVRSQLDNMHGGTASDCPHRERLPYTGDGQIAAAMVMLNFNAAAFYQKWIRDIRDAQNPLTGYVPNGAPWQPTCGGGVAWGAALNTMSWEYYLQYGDRQILEQAYQPMRAQLRNMQTWLTSDSTMHLQMLNAESGELCYWLNLGDWVPPYGMPSDEIVHTFYLWLCATNIAQTAQILGDEAGRQECDAIAQRTRRAFHRKFYDEATGSYGDFGPNVLALHMGVPTERKAKVIEALRHEIMQTHDGHINTGFVTTKFFFETLTDNGLHDVTTTAMLKTDYPSYGHWLAQGATVTWEQWDGQNSHNHPMFGGGLTWLPRRLAGINVTPDGAGYRHFDVHPYPSLGIDTVYYSLPTPQGLLTSHVISHDGHLHRLELRVPVGSTATVHLPDRTVQVEQGMYIFKTSNNGK
ncbi:MAG: family 78 glycoside hydrolase catalytic domain [Bacteroidaceae bacterium]|nr:family 78 glycoside hydrolase catalytic domain [Prevotella sp.]MBP5770128.1 family 78 glycoside hydrolase catalytic domain [Bacteroidaceae bacterium]